MVKFSWIELGKFRLEIWLEIVSLVRVALRFSLSRQIVSRYQIHGLRILGARSVWGTKDSWKGPYDIKTMVVISLSRLMQDTRYIKYAEQKQNARNDRITVKYPA